MGLSSQGEKNVRAATFNLVKRQVTLHFRFGTRGSQLVVGVEPNFRAC